MKFSRPVTRRNAIQLTAVGLGSAAILAACGSDEPSAASGDNVLPAAEALPAPSGKDCDSRGAIKRSTPEFAAAATVWPMAMRDARHTGTADVVGPRTANVKWQIDMEGAVTPGPVVGIDGSIIIATNAGEIRALDPADGTDRWRFDAGTRFGHDLSMSPLILAQGTIVWPGPRGTVFGLSRDGQLEWEVDLGGLLVSPTIAPNGRVYIVSMSGRIKALEITEGPDGSSVEEVWDLQTDAERNYASPAIGVDGETIYIGSRRGLIAIHDDGDKGRIAWSWGIDELMEVSPAIAPDGTVVVGTNDPYQYGLDPLTGCELWKIPRKDDSYASTTITPDGLAYYGDHSQTLYVVEASTGEVVRETTTERRTAGRSWGIWTAPAIDSEGACYYGTRSGWVFGLGADGEVMWDFEIGGTVACYPCIDADGTMYIGTTDGGFYAFGDA